MRRATVAVLGLAAVVGAACAEGRLTEPASAPKFARLSLTADVPARLAAETRTVVVTAAYVRASTPQQQIRLDSAAVPVTVGAGVDVPVRINLTDCLADPAREVPVFIDETAAATAAASGAPSCLVHLDVALVNASASIIGRARALVLAAAGEAVTAGPLSFSTQPSATRTTAGRP